MVEELIEKIAAESDADPDDLRNRIEAKKHELSGLVSAEGAAHLIAREEGVELAEATERELDVDNIVPGMSRVDVKLKVVDISDVRTFERDDGEGKVRSIIVGDETGTIRLTLWDEQVDVAEKVDEGDCIHITGAYTREDNRGNADLRIGNNTEMTMLDDDEIGDVKVTTSSREGGGGADHDRVPVRGVVEQNQNYEIVGTVLQLYTDNPFYKACPECNKKVEEEDDGFSCPNCGDIKETTYNMILSGIIDDGTGNMRVVFFRDRAMELLGMDEDPDGNTQLVQEHADEIMGQNVVLKGRSRYNDYFNRIEMIANGIAFTDERELLSEKLAEVAQ